MINRSIAQAITERATKVPVIGVLGPRQSGKTTLVKNLFSTYAYISLEDVDTRRKAQEDPRGFLQNFASAPGLILDEVQQVPDLLSYIQTIVDATDQPGPASRSAFFILTGSQNLMLHKSISQTLAGRISLFTLLPLSVQELKNSAYVPEKIDDAVWKGGYPRLYAKNLHPRELYPDYIETYVERDMRQILNIIHLDSFRLFIRLCAGRIGQIVNLTSLGDDCGVSAPTIDQWLSVLQTSYLIFLLQPYHKNFNKRLVKSPKLYFYDTGLACSLLGITSPEQFFLHHQRGNLFENFVIAELAKSIYNTGQRPQLYFWRDKTDNEIDCILEEGITLKAIEIKANATPVSKFFDGPKYFSKIATESVRKDPSTSSGQTDPEPTVKNFVIFAGNENQHWTAGEMISWKSIDDIFKL